MSLKIEAFKSHFENKVIIITGGAGGLGLALIKQLLFNGAKVAALDLNIDSLKKYNTTSHLLALKTDITDKRSLANAIEKVINHFSGIDILINNAGITHMSCFKDMPLTLFDTIMAVNFTASVNITRLCLPYISKSTQGQVVAISSVAGFAPLYGRSAYSASKHAMEGFFRSLASELVEDNINVLVVSPSFVKSRPELKANVNDGISSPGAIKKSTNGDELSPKFAATEILNAVVKNKQSLYLGKTSKIARWLFALFPNIYMKIMTKQAKTEFE